ncbi:MAG: 3D domain-containing protein [Acidobacteriota bacterium]
MRVIKKDKLFGFMAILAVFLTASLTGYSILIDTEASPLAPAAKTELKSAEIETISNHKIPDEEISDGDFIEFEATAYCDLGITFSGVYVQRGIVAADPRVLPIGSVIEVSAGDYSGIYTVMDTGGVIKGEIIDIFMPDYEEAVQFGRQEVEIKIIRKGWIPDYESVPGFNLASSLPAAESGDSDLTL